MYYALIAWLPTILKDAGLSESRAGFMTAVMSLSGIAASFVVPVFATEIDNQRPLVLVSAVAFLLGLAGLLAAPVAGVWAWMVLLGIGQGAGYRPGDPVYPALRDELSGRSAIRDGAGCRLSCRGNRPVGARRAATSRGLDGAGRVDRRTQLEWPPGGWLRHIGPSGATRDEAGASQTRVPVRQCVTRPLVQRCLSSPLQ